MRRLCCLFLLLALVSSGCDSPGRSGEGGSSLRDLRQGFQTSVFFDGVSDVPAAVPPAAVLERVHYSAPLGANVAYVSPVRGERRRPAMVWIAGGFDWGVGESAWAPAPRSNDQSARAFRDAGLVLMLPALRGSNGNPGRNECFFGEVEDIIAAADYLAGREDVDPERIYLGGHSTGGTLALLVAESTDRFRAVFAFGPVDDARTYGEYGCLPPDVPSREARVRAPVEFIHQIRVPTFVIEGTEESNAASVRDLESRHGSAPVQFLLVPGTDHFGVLAPGSEVVARAILADWAEAPGLSITVEAIQRALRSTSQ